MAACAGEPTLLTGDWGIKHVKTLAGHLVIMWTSSEAGIRVLVRERLAATCDGGLIY